MQLLFSLLLRGDSDTGLTLPVVGCKSSIAEKSEEYFFTHFEIMLPLPLGKPFFAAICASVCELVCTSYSTARTMAGEYLDFALRRFFFSCIFTPLSVKLF
jgi:hypothetical protein